MANLIALTILLACGETAMIIPRKNSGRGKMKNWLGATALVFAIATPALAHQGFVPREEVIHNTPEWKGERFPDGRPKVPDAILDRMKNVTLEEAWATLRFAGYEQQYEDGWDRLYA